MQKKAQLTDWQLKALREQVKEALRIKGINVDFTLTLEGDRFTGDSEEFHQVPAIHSAIKVDFWGGIKNGVKEFDNGDVIDTTNISLRVSASYIGNAVDLFRLNGEVQHREEGDILFFQLLEFETNSYVYFGRSYNEYDYD